MNKQFPSLFLLEILILFTSNAYIHATIQYVLNITTYETFLFVLLTFFGAIWLGFMVSNPKRYEVAMRLEPIINIFIVICCYLMIILYFSVDFYAFSPLRYLPFIIWIGYCFSFCGSSPSCHQFSLITSR